MKSTNLQRRTFFALVKENGLNEHEWRSLVASHTNGRTVSVSTNEVTAGELNNMIATLKQMKGVPAKLTGQQSEREEKTKALEGRLVVRKLKAQACEACGYKEGDKVDWKGRVIPYIIKIARSVFQEMPWTENQASNWLHLREMPDFRLAVLVTRFKQINANNDQSNFNKHVKETINQQLYGEDIRDQE